MQANHAAHAFMHGAQIHASHANASAHACHAKLGQATQQTIRLLVIIQELLWWEMSCGHERSMHGCVIVVCQCRPCMGVSLLSASAGTHACALVCVHVHTYMSAPAASVHVMPCHAVMPAGMPCLAMPCLPSHEHSHDMHGAMPGSATHAARHMPEAMPCRAVPTRVLL